MASKPICSLCKYAVNYYRYKIRRSDGNDCIEKRCEHPKSKKDGGKGIFICTYRKFGGLRTGNDTEIKTSPRWCPLVKGASYGK